MFDIFSHESDGPIPEIDREATAKGPAVSFQPVSTEDVVGKPSGENGRRYNTATCRGLPPDLTRSRDRTPGKYLEAGLSPWPERTRVPQSCAWRPLSPPGETRAKSYRRTIKRRASSLTLASLRAFADAPSVPFDQFSTRL
jgi:hypothetical protein